ncbi:MAG: FapA family protein [Bacillota bacterium]|nr:FapA family protein [Bacillota bacterium]
MVCEEDEIEIRLPSEPAELIYQVRVSEDKFTAFIKVEKKAGNCYCLQDTEPGTSIVLRTTKKEEKEAALPPIDHIIEDIKRQGIVFGIDRDAVSRAFTVDCGKDVVIAQGIPVTSPVDEKVEYIFLNNQEETEEKITLENADRVDYRERRKYLCVEPGEVLALKHPPQFGKHGINVYGEVIEPPLPKFQEIRVKDNVRLIEAGKKAVAVKSGRPVLKNNFLFVLPLLVIEGNVDMTTGNVSFKGDVVINGNVQEGMKVRATGMVEVFIRDRFTS